MDSDRIHRLVAVDLAHHDRQEAVQRHQQRGSLFKWTLGLLGGRAATGTATAATC